MDLEIKRLNDAGRNDLARKVLRVSLISDSYGYDIHSFEIDGKDKFIEVKATASKAGSANFYLSSNELNQAKRFENYILYMVFEIESKSPKVWPIGNPFNPENTNAVMTPTNFRITIKAEAT
ncbi:MAG: hypothetical protein C5B59_18505 [Bacteroidetes bacterium]|nr:MAG: hypothetical protein C5B59_18505 [Bacteroidota bacterium]